MVDLDFRRPKLHRAFHVENKRGITDVLVGNIELKDAIKYEKMALIALIEEAKSLSQLPCLEAIT